MLVVICKKCNRELPIGERVPGESIPCSCGEFHKVPPPQPFIPEIIHCAHCGGTVCPDYQLCEYCKSPVKPFDKNRYCPRCYAFLEEESLFCAWCGNRSIDVKYLSEATRLSCPRDQTVLSGISLGSFHGEKCSDCHGLWIATQHFAQVIAEQSDRYFVEQTPEPNSTNASVAVKYLGCPVCQSQMHRHNFRDVSGVIIDSCNAHGIWLDPRELERLAAFVRSGGLERAKQHESKRLERRLAHQRKKLNNVHGRETLSGDDLFDILESAFSVSD